MWLIERYRSLKRFLGRKRYGLRFASETALVTLGCEVANDLRIGDYSYVGPRCHICPHVKIGKYSMLANDVLIIGADHNFRNPELPTVFAGREDLRDTIIGDDVWVGARSIIMAGITVGEGAIIGAGSVVTHDVEPYTIVAGIPAKYIKERFKKEEIMIHKKALNLPLSYLKSQINDNSSSVIRRRELTKGNNQ